jgi:DNA repair photolyase
VKNEELIKGRGAQMNAHNPFDKQHFVQEHWEGIDEEDVSLQSKTEYIEVFPKSIVNKVDSPDLGLMYSMNPYQGCEHGCLYCYARNSHNYWGYSSGAEFEQKILVKKNAAKLLEEAFQQKSWIPEPIMFSGNTDCYQPAERKFGITRQMLEVCLKYRNTVSMITKNSLIERDLDILEDLNKLDLVNVSITLTSLNEDLRRLLEPRTASAPRKLRTIETLASKGIPVNVMMAPIIPGLNSHEIFELAKAVADRGASSLHYTIVRLNGTIGEVFLDWIRKTFPDRADKVINQIEECHGGKLNDSRWGVRMRGEGKTAEMISQMIKLARLKFFEGRSMKELDCSIFVRNKKGQLPLF